jgi:hypothetical protein
MYRWRCTGEGDTLSGIGPVRSIHGGYPCTGGDVRGEGDTLSGIDRVSAISTCVRDVAVHTKIAPHTFLVVRLFTVPTIESGPNRSTAVDQKGGVGPILWAGRGAIFWLPSSFARLLHVKQAFFTAWALGVHSGMIPFVGLLQVESR